MLSSRFVAGLSFALFGLTACASQLESAAPGASSAGATSGGATAGAGGHGGAAGGTGGGGDASTSDGTPTRNPCTGNFGMALTAVHGRLDGYLVAVVPPGGSHACNSDSSHVHLQVEIHGAVYDVAVNTDVNDAELDVPLPGGAWSEGWHPDMQLDYPSNLGLHSSSFAVSNPGALVQKIEGALAGVNHIAVFATGYGPTGAHDVHRRGYHDDGAIVINPLSPKAHILLFSFSNDAPF